MLRTMAVLFQPVPVSVLHTMAVLFLSVTRRLATHVSQMGKFSANVNVTVQLSLTSP